MQTYLKLFCIAFPIGLALDASWIGVIAAGFYHSQFGMYFTTVHNFPAAVLFYVFYTLAIIYFALNPALKSRSLATAIGSGAVLGFTAYMTYDLTNLATLAGWPVFGALVDISWGTLFTTLVAGLTYVVATKVFKM